MTSRSSTHSRSSAGSSNHNSDEEHDEGTDMHNALLARATGSTGSRRSQRTSANLHDLEMMQAVSSAQQQRSSTVSSLGTFALDPNESLLVSNPALGHEGDDESSNHLDVSGVSHHSATSAYSEYSEYEEDEFDPEWHARQNQQAAAALIAAQHGGGGRPSITSGIATDGTEVTRSVTDVDSSEGQYSPDEAEKAGASSMLFANRRDLRDEVDQSVNLMDASVGNYNDPRPSGGRRVSQQRQPRRGRKAAGKGQSDHRESLTTGFLAAAQNSLVDVFLDTSDSKMPSFRRTLSRNSGGSNGSLRRQATAATGGPGMHQRRLFYGHSPPPPPTIREANWQDVLCENICKFLIIAFMVVFVVLMAWPQGLWWVQEQTGMTHDDGTPVIPSPIAAFSGNEVRLEALQSMIVAYELTSSTDLMTANTPQHIAAWWLANEDPANLTFVEGDEDNRMLVTEPLEVLQRYAVATLYVALNGPQRDDNDEIIWNETNWHVSDDWMTELHVCEWHGIECEGRDEHLVHFNLTHNRLAGSLPSEMVMLSDLVLMDLSDNAITGTFPEWIDAFPDLEYCLLDHNHFEGSLSANVGNLTNLQELILSHTQLGGNLPTELNQLTQLRVLKMDHNSFQGAIPPLGALGPSLEYLSFYENHLTGAVPKDLFGLTNLVDLLLDNNRLEGTIPLQMKGMQKLEAFTISNNQFTGSIPDIFASTLRLAEFEVNNNNIRGSIPSSIGLLTDLEFLVLAKNPLTGAVPSELGDLNSLVVFEIQDTQLVGSMPKEICSLETRRSVDLIVFGDCEQGRFQCQCCSKCYGK